MFKIFLFILIILLYFPLFIFYFEESNNKLIDNRKTYILPKLNNFSDIPKFTSEFESFFNDNLPFQNKAIYINNFIKYNYFKLSPHLDILNGKNNMLFYFTKNSGDTIGDYIGTNQFSNDDLIQIKNNVLIRKELLNKIGMKFYVIVVPNKETIYEENIPDRISKKNKKSKLLQVEEALQDGKYNFLSLRKLLLIEKLKISENLYYNYDSHWNNIGSFFGYNEILKFIKKDFPQIKIIEFSDIEISKENAISNGDLISMFGLNDTFRELTYSVKYRPISQTDRYDGLEKHNIKFKSRDSNHLKIYFYCDSFIMYGPTKLLSESFEESYFIWHSLPNDPEKIKFDNLDIIIFEIAERYLDILKIPVKDIKKPWIF